MKTMDISEVFGKSSNSAYLYMPFKDINTSDSYPDIIGKISAQMRNIKSTKLYCVSNADYLSYGGFVFDKLESARFCATMTNASTILIFKVDKNKIEKVRHESVMWIPFESNVTPAMVTKWTKEKSPVQYYNIKKVDMKSLVSALNADMEFVNVNIGASSLEFRYRDINNKVLCHNGLTNEDIGKVKIMFPRIFGAKV